MNAPFSQLGNAYSRFAVFIFCAVSLVIPSGYSIGAALILLGGLFCLIRHPSLRHQLQPDDYWLFAIFLFFGLVGIISALYHGGSSRLFDKPARFILAPLGLFLLLRAKDLLPAWWAGAAIGGWTTGLWAIQQKITHEVERATGYTYVIQYGNLSMLLGLWCIAGIMWARQRHQYRRAWLLLMSTGAIMGIVGSLLSGSRGGWVGIPLVLLVFYRAYADQLRKKTQALIALALLVAAVGVYLAPGLNVQQRIHEIYTDIQTYIVQSNPHTSLGARFEMWQGAVELIKQRPLTGWGETGYTPALEQVVQAGTVHDIVLRFGHPHNEILNHLTKHGVIGLLSLLLLYALPFKLFGRGLQHPDLSQRAVAVAGVLLAVTYIDFGLSQAFLSHNSGIMFYAFGCVIIWGMYRKHNAQSDQAQAQVAQT